MSPEQPVTITQEDALVRYPELRELILIRDAGWNFRLIEQNGEDIGIAGSISRRRYTDALFIFSYDSISAARVLGEEYGGGCVWTMESTDLTEVVHELLALPEPDTRLAPHLARRPPDLLLPSGFWTPR